MELVDAIRVAKEYLGNHTFNNLNISYALDETVSGVRVNRHDNDVSIFYTSKVDLFRGLSLIKEKINETNYDDTLTHNFKTNGLMLDCSRNGVVKVDQVKELILIEALMGENRLLLYTEDTYELDNYPYFGFFRGAYTKEELKEMVSYGNSFGVSLIPCIQTLDHLERPLRWEVFNSIRDGASNLLVRNDESYAFIEEMLRVSRECFDTDEIHIGMDESMNMGLGTYLIQNGYHDRVELFCEHLSKVLELCKKYNFHPMIWSDMFFRLNSKTGEYYDCDKLPNSTKKLIPQGVKLVYWDYYHNEEEIYDRMITTHLDTKNDVIFAGGSWRWSGFAPRLICSYEFNDVALKSCIKHGVKEVFVTAWGDNGNESSIFTSLLSLAQYSVFDYMGKGEKVDVNSLLLAVTGETIERMEKLDLPNMPDKKVLAVTYNPSKFFFYQDPLLGLFDKQVKDAYLTNYNEYISTLLNASKESPKFSYMYLTLSNLCKVLANKTSLGNDLRKAYKANNKKELKRLANKVIPQIIKDINTFATSLKTQWDKENKIFGYEVLDGRIGFLKSRMETSRNTINEYLKGKTNKIEELEKEVLPYNGHDYEVSWNQWTTTVSPSGI